MRTPEQDGRGHRLAIALIAAGGLFLACTAFALPRAAPTIVAVLSITAIVLAVRRAMDHARVRELRRVATAYAAGDFARRGAISGIGSLASLGGELNALGERLAAAQDALETQRRMLDGAIGSLAEGVACVDQYDRVLYANPAWRHLTAAGGEVVRALFYEHLPAAALSGGVVNVRATGRPETVEFEHRRRFLRATVSRLDGDSLVLVLHDFTELKRLEGARRDFVGSVSHELKTPLTAIAGFAETLLDGALEDDPTAARGFIEKISRHADRLTILVRDVLTLSRLEQGAWVVRPATVDLGDLARQLCDEHQPAAAIREIRLTAEAPTGLDANQLLGNLLSNAIRYNRQGGTVTLICSADAARVQLRVIDTGIGIPEEHRERIFERFYRIDAHRSRASGGTGLGLAIVRQIVEALQGMISVDSSPNGTTFSVDIPRRDPRAVLT